MPAIDTVLFLRPTESATVFLQQLGRGLRLAEDKPCLTVFDFIGNQHAEFRSTFATARLTGSQPSWTWSESWSMASPRCPPAATSNWTG